MTDLPQRAAVELWEEWPALSGAQRLARFHALPEIQLNDFFLTLDAREQAALVSAMPSSERVLWVRLLDPDDAADMVQAAPPAERDALMALLDDATHTEVRALLAYQQDAAGGLMSPRFARIRPDMTVDEAIRYLRKQAGQVETIYYAYILDAGQYLQGVISFRELFQAADDRPVAELMHRDVISVREDVNQEAVGRIWIKQGLLAIPVLDEKNRMKGIITFDDIAHVLREETNEDIQKAAGIEAFKTPYLTTAFSELVRKRTGWLALLFVGETLTASAMQAYQNEIAAAIVLAMFIPLVISSGGNSGSQATTLVIRAMALGEVKLSDWKRVLRREIGTGLVMGAVLGAIGLARILIWQATGFGNYTHSYLRVAIAVALSLVGIVLWGGVAGSMLPFILRRFGFDPASASAPLVATLVDVTGLVIYFSVAGIVLHGSLL